jgi:uncharacterized cupredoxin-like copper-binding protein
MMATSGCGYDQTTSRNPVVVEDNPTPLADLTIDLETIDMSFEPDLIVVPAGATVAIVMTNPDRILHDFTIDEFNGGQIRVEVQPRSETTFVLTVPESPGDVRFYCSVPGHEALGMVGILRIE